MHRGYVTGAVIMNGHILSVNGNMGIGLNTVVITMRSGNKGRYSPIPDLSFLYGQPSVDPDRIHEKFCRYYNTFTVGRHAKVSALKNSAP